MPSRSEEHTSELQSRRDLVCRLLLEKKKDADEATCPSGCNGPRTSDELIAWSLTNTSSLDSASPNVHLHNKVLKVGPYGVPARSSQKAGSTPLADCLNDRVLPTPFGPGCWQILLFPPAPP